MRLTAEQGPGDLRLWHVEEPPVSELYGVPVEACVLLEGPGEVDLPLVAEVLGDVDRHLNAALRFVRAALREDPAFFGLTGDLDGDDVPLEAPQFLFYADEWHIRFAEGRLPICDPHGLAVAFREGIPTEVHDLSDAEPGG